MTTRVTLLAEPVDAALAGVEGEFEWGDCRVEPPGTAPSGDLAVRLAGAGGAPGDVPSADWRDDVAEAPGSGALVIAPAGTGLWRRAPFPAADDLFGLPSPERPHAALVGAPGPERDELIERARRYGVEVEVAERLDRGLLERATCVALLDGVAGAVPARSFAVLAARRLLVTPRAEVGFGLRHGIDHLEFADPDELVAFVRAALTRPALLDPLIDWGARAAERHRASSVFGGLVRDLELRGGPRPREEVE